MHTILVVEDNEMNRDMLLRRLQRRGFGVLAARDGREGVASAIANRPDLVLMDLGLPVVDGIEATKRLKADARTRSSPVVALTAHALVTDRDRALAAGCDDFDTKPIDFSRLLEKVGRLLARGES